MDDADLYWLAGLLEGEGTFLAGSPSSPTVPLIRVQMTDADIIERVAALIGRRVQRHRPRRDWYRSSTSTTIKGASAAHFMRLLRPVLGERRQRQVDFALSRPHHDRARWMRRNVRCSEPDCVHPALTRGLCKQHYGSWWKSHKNGRASALTPHGPFLPVAVLEIPSQGHAGAIPWLAGLLEGEGSFTSTNGYPAISVHMCDRDVIERVAGLLGQTMVSERFDERDEARGWSRSYVTAIAGTRAAEFMRLLRPRMGARRREAIDRALERYAPVRLTHPPARCTVDPCQRPHRSRGLCNAHYMMWSRDRATGREVRVRPLR